MKYKYCPTNSVSHLIKPNKTLIFFWSCKRIVAMDFFFFFLLFIGQSLIRYYFNLIFYIFYFAQSQFLLLKLKNFKVFFFF